MLERASARAARAIVIVSVLALPIGSRALAAPDQRGPAGPFAGGGKSTTYELGEDLFFHETFQGNGRTCATCHDPADDFTISPESVQARFQRDPGQPLFRPIDSNDGRSSDYTNLLDHALFRVPIRLHPNVTVVDAPDQRTITVWRGVPSLANVALTAPYQLDGRVATLPEQAMGAIRDHMQPGRRPTAKELEALAVFQRELFSPLRLRALSDGPDAPPTGFSITATSPAAVRGKASFDLHCSQCHTGELADQPSDPAGSHFTNAFVSDANTLNLPLIRLKFKQPDGTTIETITPDPGRAALTGDLRDLNLFDTPSLRGLAHTAPYFHDNSAATLDDVIDHYNSHFQFQISGQERDDLIAFLETL